MDWKGNGNSVFKTLGASNHTGEERQGEDFYATDPCAIDGLVAHVTLPHVIWEPSCGQGHLSKKLEQLGHKVISTDLVDRGYGQGGVNFFSMTEKADGDVECIVTNPPYKFATDYVVHALDILSEGDLLCLFLKTQFLEGKERFARIFSKTPPQYVLQFSERVLCAKNAEFEKRRIEGTAVAYAWYVWRKGFQGDTVLKWIAPTQGNGGQKSLF